jgi:O-antigen/teichoic acid export membrane protein
MIGLAVGALAPAVVGAVSCRVARVRILHDDHEPVLRELWTNGHTLLAFFAFTNLDVLLARYLFDEREAGIYAAGAILAKACLFLPTFVLVAAFPTMAAERGGRPWLKPLLGVATLGLVAVLGALLLPDLAVTFAGGESYADLGDVAWLFAVEGTMFACLQILVYDTIADQSHSGFLLWLGAVLVLVVALLVIDSVFYLVALVSVVAFGVGLVTSLMPGATHPD